MKSINDYDVSQLIESVDYLHPLPEEMTPQDRQEDHERKLKFSRWMNRLMRRFPPLHCLK